MNAVLEAVRAEIAERHETIDRLLAEVEGLREIEAKAEDMAVAVGVELPAEPVPEPVEEREPPKPKPRKKPAAPKAKKAPTTTDGPPRTSVAYGRELEQRINSVVAEHGPIAPAAIAEKLDLSYGGISKALRRLTKSGALIAEGERSSRRYRTGGTTEHRDRTEVGKQNAAKAQAAGVLRVKIMDLLRREEPLTENEIAQHLQMADGQARDELAFECGRLIEADQIEVLDGGAYGVMQS